MKNTSNVDGLSHIVRKRELSRKNIVGIVVLGEQLKRGNNTLEDRGIIYTRDQLASQRQYVNSGMRRGCKCHFLHSLF